MLIPGGYGSWVLADSVPGLRYFFLFKWPLSSVYYHGRETDWGLEDSIIFSNQDSTETSVRAAALSGAHLHLLFLQNSKRLPQRLAV